MTPRTDKGKQRAEPEPEEPERVLSPTSALMVTESDDEEGQTLIMEPPENILSPTTNRSKSWVEEEGEVFRKSAVLLKPEEIEGEYDSEELRKELLEAMVERPPPRAVGEGFMDDGMDIPPPLPQSPTSPTLESKKPVPRPYIRRSRSSSSSTVTLDTQNVSSLAERLQETLRTPTSGTASPVSPSPSHSSLSSIDAA